MYPKRKQEGQESLTKNDSSDRESEIGRANEVDCEEVETGDETAIEVEVGAEKEMQREE